MPNATLAAEPVSDRPWADIRLRVRQVVRIEPADVRYLARVGRELATDDRRDEDRDIEQLLAGCAHDHVLADQLAELDIEVRLFLGFADRGLLDALSRLMTAAGQPPTVSPVVLVDQKD